MKKILYVTDDKCAVSLVGLRFVTISESVLHFSYEGKEEFVRYAEDAKAAKIMFNRVRKALEQYNK